jgi:hypothetical protein
MSGMTRKDAKDLSFVTRDQAVDVVIRLMEERDACVKALTTAREFIGNQPLRVEPYKGGHKLAESPVPSLRVMESIDAAIAKAKGAA